MVEDGQGSQSNEYSVYNNMRTSSNLKKQSKTLTNARNTHGNVSIDSQSNLVSSVNPLEHNYARVLDLQLNAKLKKKPSVRDLDEINQTAGMANLYETHSKFDNSRAQNSSLGGPHVANPYYNTEARLYSGFNTASAKTRADSTSHATSRFAARRGIGSAALVERLNKTARVDLSGK